MSKTISIKVRAFNSERGAREHQVMVDESGTVRVYDDIAGHFTLCHSLTARQLDRCRKAAATN